jgi:hydroxypyruvate isomerase
MINTIEFQIPLLTNSNDNLFCVCLSSITPMLLSCKVVPKDRPQALVNLTANAFTDKTRKTRTVASLPDHSADGPQAPRLKRMRNYTANISFLFADRPFLDRIDAAEKCGFTHVECHFPYQFPIEVLKARLANAGVSLTGLNTVPGDIKAGEWGVAALPGREAEFRRDFDQALSYAAALGASVIHVMAGVISGNRGQALKTYISNLRMAARLAAPKGITLLLEPLNTRDMPHYLVSRSDDIVSIVKDIDEPNVKLLFDVYHIQIMEGDLIKRLEKHRDSIGHVQIAAVPSRAEPDEGEVNFSAIFRALDAIDYRGLIGLEYKPRGRTEDGLSWMKKSCSGTRFT